MPVLTKKTTTVKHPLNFMEIFADVGIELPQQPNLNMVKAEVNKVIRRINDDLGLWREMVRVAAGTITTGWQNLDTNNWNAEDDQNWDRWGKFTHGWDYDDADNILRLSDIVVEVEEVYFDNEEWECVSYEEVKDSDNSSEKIFAQIGRYLYFPFNLSTSSKVCDIRVKQSYSFVETTITTETVIDLPESYRQLLISGCLTALASRGKYKDPDIYTVNKEIFDREFVSLQNQYHNLETKTVYEPKYKYY